MRLEVELDAGNSAELFLDDQFKGARSDLAKM
jgi:hypothetical protein